jgi:ABC-type nitrate/sulfonate/bicarbonate transport system permease component
VSAPSHVAVPATTPDSHTAVTSRRLRGDVPDAVYGVAGVVTLFVAWWLVTATGLVSTDSLPDPVDVLQRLATLLTDGSFLAELLATLAAWAVAMGIGVLVAVPLGLLMGYFVHLYRPASTVVNASRSVPSSALLPIAILLFGLGLQMKVSLALYALFWPMLLNAMYGVRDAEPLMLAAGRSMGWNRWALLRRIVLPAASSSIATGVRVASSIALVVVLSTELLGAESGVGTVITRYGQTQQPDYVYAGILVIGLVGMLLYYTLNLLERLVIPWAHARRADER